MSGKRQDVGEKLVRAWSVGAWEKKSVIPEVMPAHGYPESIINCCKDCKTWLNAEVAKDAEEKLVLGINGFFKCGKSSLSLVH